MSFALSLERDKAGRSIAANIAIMAMTTRSSMSVNPPSRRRPTVLIPLFINLDKSDSSDYPGQRRVIGFSSDPGAGTVYFIKRKYFCAPDAGRTYGLVAV